MGTSLALEQSLIDRGIADTYINRHGVPREVYDVIPVNADFDTWMKQTDPFLLIHYLHL